MQSMFAWQCVCARCRSLSKLHRYGLDNQIFYNMCIAVRLLSEISDRYAKDYYIVYIEKMHSYIC